MKRKLFAAVAFLFVFLLVGETCAREAIEKCPTGSINWTQGIVYASGMGPIEESLRETSRGKIIARRVAIVDCQRNLLETTKEVRITSTTIVRNAMLESDVVETAAYGLIKNAEIVSEDFDEEGIYHVTMKMPLAGKFLGVVLKKDMLFSKREPGRDRTLKMDVLPILSSWFRNLGARDAHAAEFVNEELTTLQKVLRLMKENGPEVGVRKLELLIDEFEKNTKYTGVLVDARKAKGFKMAACPLIRSANGKTIYPGQLRRHGRSRTTTARILRS